MFEILTAVLMRIQDAWDVNVCSLIVTKFLKDRSAFNLGR
jgi:hypothetical protein